MVFIKSLAVELEKILIRYKIFPDMSETVNTKYYEISETVTKVPKVLKVQIFRNFQSSRSQSQRAARRIRLSDKNNAAHRIETVDVVGADECTDLLNRIVRSSCFKNHRDAYAFDETVLRSFKTK